MTTVFLFLLFFFLSLPQGLPQQRLSLNFFRLLKNSVFLVISLKPFFSTLLLSRPHFFLDIYYLRYAPLKQQKNKKFWVYSSLLSVLSHPSSITQKFSVNSGSIYKFGFE